jgi:ABC-type cobalamin/Fe3+-siderophores transport system ATPase subunit
MDLSITLPGGEVLEGFGPVVVVGPNGSGKSRQARQIQSTAPREFVNALRNTRIAPSIPAMGYDDARNNFASQRNMALSQHWELSQDFDYMLSQLLAQDAMASKEFVRQYRRDATTVVAPPETPLSRVEEIWGEVFPGRELLWEDWKPKVRNSITDGEPVEYSANTMSDGEKAALYLAGRVFSAPSGILIVDEPETHLHTLLAIRLWDILNANDRICGSSM